MRPIKTAVALSALMALASVTAYALQPRAKAGDRGLAISLDKAVPRQFGDWRELPSNTATVVNPQTKELLDKIYSQLVSRTYVNSAGDRVMLSLAYGDDQRGALQAHMPEVCYPAQGFKLHHTNQGMVRTDFGSIPVKRVFTSLGTRQEPITYWFTMGDQAVMSGRDKRLAELKLALTGQIPDGLLFRVSTIAPDQERSYSVHDRFVNDLLRAVSTEDRGRLSGLGGDAVGGATGG